MLMLMQKGEDKLLLTNLPLAILLQNFKREEENMVNVIEEYPKPVAQVRCGNCGSLLEYGNADLHYKMSNEIVTQNIVALKGYYIWCPVCGCEVAASRIPRPEKGGEA